MTSTLPKFVRPLGVVVVLASLGALVACSQPATPAAPTKAAPAAATQAAPAAPTAQATAAAAAPAPTQAAAQPTAAPETIKFGILTPVTGPTSRIMLPAERLIRMSVDDLNAKGGFKVAGKTYRLEALPTVDDKSTAEGGREGANKLVLADKVKYITGTTSTPAAGAQAITEPNKVLFLAHTAVDKSLGPNFPLTVQIGSHTLMRIPPIYDLLAQEHPQAKRVALMYSDDPTGRNLARAAEAAAQQRGLSIVAQDFYPLDIKDFTPLVARVLRQNPDAIDVGAAGGRATIFTNQMKAISDQGFKGPVFGMSAEVASLQEGAAFMEGFTTSALVDFQSPILSPKVRDVIDRYIAKYGAGTLDSFAIPDYNAPWLLAQVMEKAGTIDDTEKLAKTLREGTWDSIYDRVGFVGVKTFGLPSVMEQPIYIGRLEKGKLVTPKAMKGMLP